MFPWGRGMWPWLWWQMTSYLHITLSGIHVLCVLQVWGPWLHWCRDNHPPGNHPWKVRYMYIVCVNITFVSLPNFMSVLLILSGEELCSIWTLSILSWRKRKGNMSIQGSSTSSLSSKFLSWVWSQPVYLQRMCQPFVCTCSIPAMRFVSQLYCGICTHSYMVRINIVLSTELFLCIRSPTTFVEAVKSVFWLPLISLWVHTCIT